MPVRISSVPVLAVGLGAILALVAGDSTSIRAVSYYGAGQSETERSLEITEAHPDATSPGLRAIDHPSDRQVLCRKKLDPLLRMMLTRDTHGAVAPGTAAARFPLHLPVSESKDAAFLQGCADRYIPCHIRFASQDWALSEPGAVVRARAGDVGLLAVKAEALESLASRPEVVAMRLALPMSFKNDMATLETGAAQARSAYGASGAGVILGFIGSGVDASHPDFLDGGGRSRILYLLDLSEPGDTDGDGVLDGPDFFGGTLYTRTQIDSALAGLRDITGWDRRGHETHVMGTAAGNGNGTGNGFPQGTFAGVAPEAELVVIKSSLADLGFVGPGEASAGLAFVDSVAREIGSPYVVDMSFGMHLSAHDGTSLEERFIDNLVGRGKPGKAVVVSAGNEGSNYGASPFLHCSESLAEGQAAACTFTLPAYSPEPGELNDGLILDMWYESADEIRVSVRSPDGVVHTASTGESKRWAGGAGSVFIENAPSPDLLNLDNECFIQIDDGDGSPPAAGTWSIELQAVTVAETGRFDLWLAFSSGLGGQVGFDSSSPVTNEGLVASPGNAFNAITVGSYTNKESWLDLDNNLIYFEPLGEPPTGAIAPGSSPGPSRDRRTKPELAAPGRAVASTLSGDAWPGVSEVSIFSGCPANARRCLIAGDGRHAIARGTSFAAAHVAGAAALLLQALPSLDAQELRDLLVVTARSAGVTGGPWGYGKVDVLAALESADASRLVEFFRAVREAARVRLLWRAMTGAGAEGFRIYRAYAVRGPYQLIHSSSGLEGNYVDTGFEPDRSLYYRLGVILPGGQERTLPPISPSLSPIRPEVRLISLYPNPARLLSNLRFSSTVPGTAIVSVHDAAGRLVGERIIQVPDPDVEIEFKWLWVDGDGNHVPSGVYFMSVELAGSTARGKTVVLR